MTFQIKQEVQIIKSPPTRQYLNGLVGTITDITNNKISIYFSKYDKTYKYTEKNIKPIEERPIETIPEPIIETIPEPIIETIPEPIIETIPEPIVEIQETKIITNNTMVPKIISITKSTFTEIHDMKKVNYILSLQRKERSKIFYDDNMLQRLSELYNTDGTKMTMKAHDLEMVKYLTSIRKNKGILKINYEPSKKQLNGRLYSTTPSLQRCGWKMRHFLSDTQFQDIDMKNAFPTILKYLFTKHSLTCESLNNYVNNRQMVLETTDLTKKDILKVINQDIHKHKKGNKYLSKLHKEITACKDKLLCNYPHLITSNSYNPKSSMVCNLLCIYENKILQNAMKCIGENNIITPFFDGMLVKNEITINIEELDKSSLKYGVKWCLKPFENTIKIPDDFDETCYYEISYKSIKEKLENDFFICIEPLCYAKYNKTTKNYVRYDATKTRQLLCNIKYYDENENKTKCIFDEWLGDEDRREYDNMDFIPYSPLEKDFIDQTSSTFNTFVSYPRNILDLDNDEIVNNDGKVGNFMRNYFKPLVADIMGGKDELDAIEYFIKLFALMFQKPRELSGVAWVCKSLEGAGKDTMVRIITALMGDNKYLAQSSNMDDILGNFNKLAMNKQIIQFNELDGKQGLANHNKLKDIITADYMNVKLKGIDTFTTKHYSQYCIFTNEMSSVVVGDNARRIFMTEAIGEYIGNTNFFEKLHEELKNPDVLDGLYTYFMNVDLTGFRPSKNIPKTKIYNQQQIAQIHPVYKFLWECCISDWVDSGFSIINNRGIKYMIITPNDFNINFNNYCNNENIKSCSSKKYNMLLDNLECIKRERSIRIDNKPTKHITINFDNIKDELDTKFMKIAERNLTTYEEWGDESDIQEVYGNTQISNNECQLDQ